MRENTISKKKKKIPEHNGRLIILGNGEIKGRASLQKGFLLFFFGWQRLAGKVAGKAKERTKTEREHWSAVVGGGGGGGGGGGLFLAACLCKWLTCCGIMRRLSVELPGEQPSLIEGS